MDNYLSTEAKESLGALPRDIQLDISYEMNYWIDLNKLIHVDKLMLE